MLFISANKKNENIIREIKNMLLSSKNKDMFAKMRPHISKPKINYSENVCQCLDVWYQ